MKRARLVAVALALALLGDVGSSRADGTSEAKERFDEAAKAFAGRRYADAAEAYERAAALSPHPAPLVNAAEAWELDGNFIRAARACDAALRLELNAETRAKIERRLVRLERSIATLELSGETSLAVSVDDGAVVTPPARLRLSPGKHVVTLRDPSSDVSRRETLTLAAGDHRQLMLETLAAASSTPADPANAAGTGKEEGHAPGPAAGRTSGPPLATWITAGAGVATAAAATIFGILTVGSQSDFNAHPTSAAADDFEHKRAITNVLFAVSGVAFITAGAIWILAPRAGGTAISTPLTRVLARGLRVSFD